MRTQSRFQRQRRQRGAAAVEFALIAAVFIALLLAIVEFGRALYVYNTIQEATRNLARRAVVALTSASNTNAFKQNNALFGGTTLPAGAEVAIANVSVQFLDSSLNAIASPPANQFQECLLGNSGCVAYVRVRVTGATYVLNSSIFALLGSSSSSISLPLPASTVTMPAENMGYAPS